MAGASRASDSKRAGARSPFASMSSPWAGGSCAHRLSMHPRVQAPACAGRVKGGVRSWRPPPPLRPPPLLRPPRPPRPTPPAPPQLQALVPLLQVPPQLPVPPQLQAKGAPLAAHDWQPAHHLQQAGKPPQGAGNPPASSRHGGQRASGRGRGRTRCLPAKPSFDSPPGGSHQSRASGPRSPQSGTSSQQLSQGWCLSQCRG